MLRKILLLVFALALPLLLLSCGGQQPKLSSATPEPTDILSFLRKPGKITHIRYTTYTPPWPTRTEAWIDWDHNRVRAWNVQWTDSPTNPSVCTSIRNGDDWSYCLPSPDKLTADDIAAAGSLWPEVPLRASDAELSVQLPLESVDESTAQPAGPVRLGGEPTTSQELQDGTQVTVRSWKITSALGIPCQDGKPGPASFEYRSAANGSRSPNSST